MDEEPSKHASILPRMPFLVLLLVHRQRQRWWLGLVRLRPMSFCGFVWAAGGGEAPAAIIRSAWRSLQRPAARALAEAEAALRGRLLWEVRRRAVAEEGVME